MIGGSRYAQPILLKDIHPPINNKQSSIINLSVFTALKKLYSSNFMLK